MPVSRFDIAALKPVLANAATILVPNHRIRDAILSAITDATDENVFRTPQVYAIDIWIRELWDLAAHGGQAPFCDWQLLSSAQEQFVWTAIIEASLAEFPLLNPEETARAVNQSYRDLKQWIPVNPLARLQQMANTADALAFHQWIQSYQRHCERLQLLSLVDAIEKLLALPTSDWARLPALPHNICFVNFFEPPPLYAKLFAKLADVAHTSTLAILNESTPRQKYRHTFTDQTAELVACATWAKQLQEAAPNSHIGIIYSADFLAQSTLRHQLETVLSDARLAPSHTPNKLYNSSGSRQRLTDAASVHDAFLLLNLNNELQQSNDLCRLLQSPYLVGADTEQEARLRMEQQMRRYFTAVTALTDFSWHLQQTERPTCAPLLASALLNVRTFARQFPGSATSREWALHISAWLSEFGWPGTQLNPAEADAFGLWQDTLRSFANSSVVLGKLSFAAAVSRLKTLCNQQPLPHPFRHENPLSIYSVAEASGLRFEHVWLLGFSAQSWPPSIHPAPFIPYALQQEARIPGCHSDIQLQQAQQQMQILDASVTGDLIASYHRLDGELEFSPSSFIANWPERAVTINPAAAASLPGINFQTPAPMETIADLAAFALQAEENVRGGQSIISNQSSCPFRAFARHRLDVEPLEPFTTGLSMRDRGSALHAALEILFTDIDSLSTLNGLDTAARSALIAKAAVHAIDFLSQRHRQLMTPRFRQIEQQRIETLLTRFLELENTRDEFTVIAREESLHWQFDKLQLRLKIDRIDKLNDNSLALIDYKTGKHVASSQSWTQERPEDMQLPLYYTVATDSQDEAITALAIAHVNAEKIAYSGLAASGNVQQAVKAVSEDRRINTDWPTLTANWQEQVRLRAQEFVSGEAQVAPVNGRHTCQYCGLESLCRIQELDSSELDEDSETEADA